MYPMSKSRQNADQYKAKTQAVRRANRIIRHVRVGGKRLNDWLNRWSNLLRLTWRRSYHVINVNMLRLWKLYVPAYASWVEGRL